MSIYLIAIDGMFIYYYNLFQIPLLNLKALWRVHSYVRIELIDAISIVYSLYYNVLKLFLEKI